MNDTIVALSTAAGAGAIAIVRLSGPDAAPIGRRVYRGRLRERRLSLGTLLDAQGIPLDRGMAVYMPGPRSYTGEDVVELHCHGGPLVAKEMVAACMGAGARPAQPGEFTRRAYLAGRMDLSQAQAVMDMIAANSLSAGRASFARMQGGLSRKVRALEDRLLDAAAELTAYLDYPDEDLEPVTARGTLARIDPVMAELREAIARAPMARRTLEGVRVAIAGAPNAGKSSLLNALLEQDRAIVTDIPGTTRDTLSETLQIDGVAFMLTDTAGLRESGDAVERLGVERARAAIRGADILILCVDAAQPLPDEAKAHLEDPRALLALNKSDLPVLLQPGDFMDVPGLACVTLSTLTGEGLEDLRQALLAKAEVVEPADALLSHEHDLQCATSALTALSRAQQALRGLSLDCAALDIEDALASLGEITGTDRQALIDRVFSSFCLGK